MRKTFLTILLAASVAVPAMAQDQGGRRHDRGGQSDDSAQGEQRQPPRADRVERQRPMQSERSSWSDRAAARQQSVQQQDVTRPANDQRSERRSWQQRRSQDEGILGESRRGMFERATSGEGDREQFRRDVSTRDGAVIRQDRYRTRDGDVIVRRGTGEASSSNSRTATQWNSQWRRDNHYDWRSHRDRHRSIYRLGYYRDPYGSRYRRFSIGFSLFPSYYRSSYWLDDPFMYRLPPAYGPYRWIRYYDDALLVNVYTGRVVDVVYDFFW